MKLKNLKKTSNTITDKLDNNKIIYKMGNLSIIVNIQTQTQTMG